MVSRMMKVLAVCIYSMSHAMSVALPVANDSTLPVASAQNDTPGWVHGSHIVADAIQKVLKEIDDAGNNASAAIDLDLPQIKVDPSTAASAGKEVFNLLYELQRVAFEQISSQKPVLSKAQSLFNNSNFVAQNLAILHREQTEFLWNDAIAMVYGGMSKASSSGESTMELLAPMPVSCAMSDGPDDRLVGAVGAVHDDHVVTCGGTVGVSAEPSALCLKLKPKATKWVEDVALPTARAFAAGVVVPHRGMWITGGIPDMRSSVERESVDGGIWLSGPYLPHALAHHCASLSPDGNVVFIYGGKTTDAQGNWVVSNLTWSYHWEEGAWRQEADLLQPRCDPIVLKKCLKRQYKTSAANPIFQGCSDNHFDNYPT